MNWYQPLLFFFLPCASNLKLFTVYVSEGFDSIALSFWALWCCTTTKFNTSEVVQVHGHALISSSILYASPDCEQHSLSQGSRGFPLITNKESTEINWSLMDPKLPHYSLCADRPSYILESSMTKKKLSIWVYICSFWKCVDVHLEILQLKIMKLQTNLQW